MAGLAHDAIALVETSVGSEQAARAMARQLIDTHMAACVHLSRMQSIYRWDGAVQDEPEWLLSCKTSHGRAEALAAAIAGMHPYDLPEIRIIAVAAVTQDYASWVAQESSG